MPFILGRKLGMSRIFEADGRVIPVTLIHCPPSKIAQIKTPEKDGVSGVVLGLGKTLRQFPVEKPDEYKLGDEVTVEKFKDVKTVALTGTSKGKGFAGFIKRYHFSSGPGSHGSHFKREPGSIGARAKPGRVHKGKRMAGRMGMDRVTLKHVPLVEIDTSKNLLAIKGQVPGPRGGIILIQGL